MDLERFEQACRLGLGRAHVMLRAEGGEVGPEVEEILRGIVLHNTAVDPQIDGGDRALFAWELIEMAGLREKFAPIVRDALLAQKEHWDLSYLYRVARRFVKAGSTELREVMYEKMRRDDADQRFWGVEELVKMDGVKGLLVTVAFMGKRLKELSEEGVDETFLPWMSKVLEVDTFELARSAADTDSDIAYYLQKIEAARKERDSRDRPKESDPLPWGEFWFQASSAPEKVGPYAFTRWGRAASAEDIREASHETLIEASPDLICKWLAIFHSRAFVGDVEILIGFARSSDERVEDAACRALFLLRDKRIREFVLKRISEGHRDGHMAKLLLNHYQQGDERIVEKMFDDETDEDLLHSLGRGVNVGARKESPFDPCALYLKVYEKCNCCECRHSAVQELRDRQGVSGNLAEECRWDASIEIRAMFDEKWVEASKRGE